MALTHALRGHQQLVPGDLVALKRTEGDLVVPCDVLILAGSCVVNEALLTGESVPQIKVCVGSFFSVWKQLS